MSYFSQLDEMIQERTGYVPEQLDDDTGELTPEQNLSQYLQFRDEINDHISGRLEFDQLSPIAQDLMRDWEDWCEQMSARYECEFETAMEEGGRYGA